MALELLYTSAPKGLKPGSSGYCTVGATAGIPQSLAERLESLSSYQPLFPAGSTDAHRNPIAWSHWRLFAGGRTRSVLSRVGFAGLDYTLRPNKLAYHLVLEPAEQTNAGPAWLLMQPGVMATEWTEEAPRLFSAEKVLPRGESLPRVCATWNALTGDAGWAGVLAESFLLDPARTAYVIYEPAVDLILLLDEALALLPPQFRWQISFSTYFSDLPAGLSCAWRFVVAGSGAEHEARRHASGALFLDLTTRSGGAPECPAAHAARSGEFLAPPPPLDPGQIPALTDLEDRSHG